MKIYMMTDLEGVSGVVQWEPRKEDTHEAAAKRAQMRRLLTGEVNAAIEGLFEAGATEVIVNDGHGSGYTIDFEQIDPRVVVIHGTQRPFWLPLLDETCDATILIGAHPRAGTPAGVLYHTQSSVIKRTTVNGIEIGEMGQQALIAGHYDVPMIFVSGDEAACKEISELIPNIETVAVKKGLSRFSAVSIPPKRAREMIKEGVKRAMKKIDKIKPFKLQPPLVWRNEYYSERYSADALSAVPEAVESNVSEYRADDVITLVKMVFGYK